MKSDYDNSPYVGCILSQLSPDSLAIGSIWSKEQRKPIINNSRYIELGCGDAANLICLAFYHSDMAFVGVDNSSRGIESANKISNELGLDNITLFVEDVHEFREDRYQSSCDFIVSHGLYSWVSVETRIFILKICQNKLTQQGLAYISYNAEPGWSTRKLVRETLLQSPAVQDANIEDKANEAIKLATKLLEELPSRDYAHAALLGEELERVRDGDPSYVFHEYLTEHNEGFWLKDFVAHAKKYGLDYICDAQPRKHEGAEYTNIKKSLAEQEYSLVDQEQTADLLCNRTFRASILCREDCERIETSKEELIQEFYIASSLKTASDTFDLTEGIVEVFLDERNYEITLDEPISKAAAFLLSTQWPWGDRLDILFDKASNLLESNRFSVKQNDYDILTKELILLYEAGYVDFRMNEPPHYSEMPSKPKLHALAEYELEQQRPLTSPYHLPVLFEDEMLEIVKAVDGKSTVDELSEKYNGNTVLETVSSLSRWGLLERS